MSDDLAADEREGLMLIGEMRAHLGRLPSNLRPVADALIGTMEVALERKFKDAATIVRLRADLDAANERAEKLAAAHELTAAQLNSYINYAAEQHDRANAAEADAAALRALVIRAQEIIDPCHPARSHEWQKDARVTLAPAMPEGE